MKDGLILDGLPEEDATPDAYSAALFLREGSAAKERIALTSPSAGEKTVAFNFRWEDRPGRPAAVDLSLGSTKSSGQIQPLFQVFERQGRPFARAGLKVVPLTPAMDYRVEVSVVNRGATSQLRVELSPLLPGRQGQAIEVIETEALVSSTAFHLARTSSINASLLPPSRS